MMNLEESFVNAGIDQALDGGSAIDTSVAQVSSKHTSDTITATPRASYQTPEAATILESDNVHANRPLILWNMYEIPC